MSQAERQKEWDEQFGDHTECPVCGTACEMLFVEEKRSHANLLHAVEQLCSDVERSISGVQGAHKQAIARVRKLMEGL